MSSGLYTGFQKNGVQISWPHNRLQLFSKAIKQKRTSALGQRIMSQIYVSIDVVQDYDLNPTPMYGDESCTLAYPSPSSAQMLEIARVSLSNHPPPKFRDSQESKAK